MPTDEEVAFYFLAYLIAPLAVILLVWLGMGLRKMFKRSKAASRDDERPGEA